MHFGDILSGWNLIFTAIIVVLSIVAMSCIVRRDALSSVKQIHTEAITQVNREAQRISVIEHRVEQAERNQSEIRTRITRLEHFQLDASPPAHRPNNDG